MSYWKNALAGGRAEELRRQVERLAFPGNRERADGSAHSAPGQDE